MLAIISLSVFISACYTPDQENKTQIQYGKKNASEREIIQCPDINDRIVIAIIGQSQAANAGQTLYKSTGNVFEMYGGECYKAQDPLLMNGGNNGSVWSRLGDLIADDTGKQIVFAAFARGGTFITDWINGGRWNEMMIKSFSEMQASGMDPDYIIWKQGANDVGRLTSKQYYDNFVKLKDTIRSIGISAPIIVSTGTMCFDIPDLKNKEIYDAKMQAINDFDDVLAGPYTDVLGFEYRYDDCHFNAVGLWEHAYLWEDSLSGILGYAQ